MIFDVSQFEVEEKQADTGAENRYDVQFEEINNSDCHNDDDKENSIIGVDQSDRFAGRCNSDTNGCPQAGQNLT